MSVEFCEKTLKKSLKSENEKKGSHDRTIFFVLGAPNYNARDERFGDKSVSQS